MRSVITFLLGLVTTVEFLTSTGFAASPSEIFPIWPADKMPGRSATDAGQPERKVSDRRRPYYQLTNISTPTVSVFLAPEKLRTGGAVLVCPGGGLQRLAYEHEGLEIADWLNPLGISVFVLKYRVPAPSATSVLDAQRAMGLIRHRAKEFQVDPDRIGVMGFSAGAEVAVLLAVQSQQRGYAAIDEADSLSARPNNACSIYAGGLARDGNLRRDISSQLDSKRTPAMFIVHAFADASENSLALATELKRAKVPCEMHLYQEGGHGFGARDSGLPLNGWKASYLQWLRAQGFFDRPEVIAYADQLGLHLRSHATLSPLTSVWPQTSLSDGYAAQRRYVRKRLEHDVLVGYRCNGGLSEDAKPEPLSGILFGSDRIELTSETVMERPGPLSYALETGLGYVVSTGADVSTHIRQVEHIKGAFEVVAPTLQLVLDDGMGGTRTWSAADRVAVNLGGSRFLMGKSKVTPDEIEEGEIAIHVQKDGERIASGKTLTSERRWAELMAAVNHLVDQGYSLRQGDLVICSVVSKPIPAKPGRYTVEFGSLGRLEFSIK